MTEHKRGPKGGVCRYCGRPTGGIIMHERNCLKRDNDQQLALMDNHLTRAAAHAHHVPPLPREQRWRDGVTDEHVAEVFYAIEAAGAIIQRTPTRRWKLSGCPPELRFGSLVGQVIAEMIRTGLLRHWVERTPSGEVDHLIPARVHLRDPRDRRFSACRFTGEDMGPMRSRLVDDLWLVDCLECEAAVAAGYPRGL